MVAVAAENSSAVQGVSGDMYDAAVPLLRASQKGLKQRPGKVLCVLACT